METASISIGNIISFVYLKDIFHVLKEISLFLVKRSRCAYKFLFLIVDNLAQVWQQVRF